ncbi:MAG: DUF4920 domain-containing protein [Cellvibrionaceae bacterium]
MKILCGKLALPFIIFFALTSTAHSAETFGDPISISHSQSMSIEKAIQFYEHDVSKDKKPALITAQVISICETKGCWMGLETEAEDIRVTFKNYGFFVPPTLVGKTVDIQGTIKKVTLSLKDTKHYVKDAGGDPETVTEPKIEYQIIATGVQIHKD